MPLAKSKSPQAFHQNVSEMVKAGHPVDQALAAAFRVQREAKARKRKADGGSLYGDVSGVGYVDPQNGEQISNALSNSWIGRMVKDAASAATLPGDVYQGKVSVYDDDGNVNPDVMSRTLNLAGLMVGTPGGSGGLGSGARIARAPLPMDEASRMASFLLGSGATDKRTAAILAGANAANPFQPIRAYHGSPYDFDKFDLSKIGTGEGAQAYGHGIYLAENPLTAQRYRDDLTAMRVNSAKRALEPYGNDVDGAIAKVSGEIERLKNLPNAGNDPVRRDSLVQINEAKLGELLSLKNTGAMSRGRMYEVDINAHPEQFLDWDRAISEQSPFVKDAIAKVDASAVKRVPSLSEIGDPQIRSVIRSALRQNEGQANDLGLIIDNDSALYNSILQHAKRAGVDLEKNDMRASDYAYSKASPFIDALHAAQTNTGEAIHRALAKNQDMMQQGPVASQISKAGIPGIRYLDQLSRSAGDGTRNYVVFDPSLVDIVRKYRNGGETPFTMANGGRAMSSPYHYASGGSTPFYIRAEAHGLEHAGMIPGMSGGRADVVPTTVRSGSYVIPADTVSSLGQGNSMSGANTLNRLFSMGPYGASMPHIGGGRSHMPSAAPKLKAVKFGKRAFADGGEIVDNAPPVDIDASDGEFVVPPDKVAELGGGDIERGHDVLDAFVLKVRSKAIKKLKSIPGPKDD